jgi:hypothetical protein
MQADLKANKAVYRFLQIGRPTDKQMQADVKVNKEAYKF